MAKIRDILSRVDVETASRARICHRNRTKHTIPKSGVCLVVYDERGGRKNYCPECAAPILKHARAELDRIDSQLRGTGAS